MKKIQLLGYNTYKEHRDAGTNRWQEHDEGGEFWDLFFQDSDNNYYMVAVSSTYGSCGSGYCGASWGNIAEIKQINDLPVISFKAPKLIYIELTSEGNLNPGFQTPTHYFDAEIETLLSTEGEIIATSTGNGGCSYYPSGRAEINIDYISEEDLKNESELNGLEATLGQAE